MQSVRRLACSGLLAFFLFPCALAQAVIVVDGTGSTVTVTGDETGTDVVIGTADAAGTDVRIFISGNRNDVQSGGVDEPCGQHNGSFVTCNLDSPLTQATVNLGGGADDLQRGLGGFSGSLGEDQHDFDLNADLGDGNDNMTVAFNGGATMSNGGNGYDDLAYANCSDCQAGVTVNFAAGPGLNFEQVDASPGDDTLTGTARTTLPDDGDSDEVEEIAGLGGNDVINDGGGRDLVEGDDGNDTINTLDQVEDKIDCGLGNDSLNVDPEDLLFNCETTAGPPVAIGSGPSGTTSSRTAHFEFTTTDPSPPAGQFQCRIDGQPDFTTCTSPVDLANLSDGAHTFRVRYDPTGSDPPGPVTERTWTVDATAPSVVFDSAPSGDENGSTAQFTFHASESGAVAFECQLDGGAFFACASPHSEFGLSDGAHTFSVRATDAAGNTGAAASRSWTVSPLEGEETGCSSAGLSAGFGVIRLVARTPEACFVTETVDGQPARVSRGVVTLNGITLTPATGTRIIVVEGLGDGTVRADGPVTMAFGPPPRPANDPLALTLPRLDLSGLGSSASVVNKIFNLTEANSGFKVAGLKVQPGLAFEFAADNGGQLKVTFRLALPTLAFKKLPGSSEGLTVEFSPTFSNDRGVTFGGRIKVGTAYLFGKKVKDLDLAYDHGTGLFEGSLGVVLGPEQGGIEPVLTGSITIGPPLPGPDCGFRKLGLVASNLQRLVGPGVFLQRMGGTFECVPAGSNLSVKLTAVGGVSLGPRVSIGGFETEAVSIDGTTTLTLPVTQSAPFTLEATGVGKVVDFPVSSQTVTYTSPATIRLTGGLDMTIGGYGAQLTYGEQGTFISPTAFNIEAAGNANVFGFRFGAQAVFSSTGFAVCIGEDGDRFGFGRQWGGELTAFVVCDVGPFRTAAPSSAAQAGRRSFTVEDGRPLTVVAAEGGGAPPKVVVSGPGGTRIETPAGTGGLSNKRVLLVQDPQRDTTFVVLFKPAPGRWSVAGSGLRRVRVARGLPPVKLAAKVKGSGSRRTLTWRARGLSGQRLQLVERGRGGANVLTSTRRAVGRLRFTPDPALGKRRTIEAIVLNRGIPRSSRTVARFRFSIPARPSRIRGLKLEKRTLSWRAQRGIASYELVVVRPNGTTSNHTARRARLKLAGLPRSGTLRVSIVAVNALGRSGPIKNARIGL